jgi:hypothetical protein
MKDECVRDLENDTADRQEVDPEKDLSVALLLQLAVVDVHDESDQRHDMPLKVF